MRWLTMMWHRFLHKRPEPPAPPPRPRDPDLDRTRETQHDLINKVTSDRLRRQLRERRIDTQADTWRRAND